MDTKVFIKELKDIFCDTNREDVKYSKVWLTDADFGGLYNSGNYILNVKAEHKLDNCTGEIKTILNLLKDKLTEEKIEYIRRVNVYNSMEVIHCQSDDIILYSENEHC